uniref:BMP and activin membrane-bound inhibitor homolog (Xenopus laevis) b n=2 Tax=Eptatretus burgeri TaxID=7764 RepID=A0A8C4X016_EPTBU
MCTLFVALSKGDIRCYCDAPHCVVTGYMCKSPAAGCFSRPLRPAVTNSPRTHGCLESLGPSHASCQLDTLENRTEARVLLHCCQEDMCNYQDAHQQLQLNDGREELWDSGRWVAETRAEPPARGPTVEEEDAREQDLWLRAAVIAVPVAGALVLVLLIGLALRLLRSEARRQRLALHRLGCSLRDSRPPPVRGSACCPACDGLICDGGSRKTPSWPQGQWLETDGGGSDSMHKPSAWPLGRWDAGGVSEKVAFV